MINRVARDERIKSRFNELHNGKQRLRIDDVLNKLAEEFSLAAGTIQQILNGNYYKQNADKYTKNPTLFEDDAVTEN